MRTVHVPEPADDLHTLLVAVPVDVATLDDPSAINRAVARATALARQALEGLTIAEGLEP